MNEQTTVELSSNQSFDILVDDMFQTHTITVITSQTTSFVQYHDVSGYNIEYSLDVTTENGTFPVISPYASSKTVTVNEYDGFGTITLLEGTNTIEFIPVSSQAIDMEDSFHFMLMPSSYIMTLLFTIFTGFGTIALLVVFIYLKNKSYKIDSFYYDDDKYSQSKDVWSNQYSDQDLFDMNDDDIFSQYTENKKHNSSWDDE
jgi:hypothetical protein